ncbi:hypothetical protein NHX12_001886 [Muraenolepis orangiensis]|uniref:DNA-directed RNA polymerase III subunit n=1 Tax=Muraenolepis orangiensis TaxID=630683 RepID=A0A9Q0IIL2_9TELE|nr:hypothetical protein NHX12_001886 [Muraenolepis orangiensis]
MAARGRGRGRSNLTFSIEAVGFGKGESLPPSILQPTPLFPPMEHKPVPLATGEEAEYMQALKQEFRGAMKSLPFYIRPAAPKTDVERYSDKYHSGEPADNTGVDCLKNCVSESESPKRTGTDYIMSYFDNGEEFGADSDENIDEAVY